MTTYTYICFFNRRSIEVQARTTYEAQTKAAAIFKAKQTRLVSVHRSNLPATITN